jgi:hypothetical protein
VPSLLKSPSLVELGHEIIDHRWPAAIIFKVLKIASSLLIQLVEQIPRVLRDHEDFTSLKFAIKESLPLVEKPAIWLSDQKIPESACKLYIDISLALILCELEGKVIHLLILRLIVELLSKSRENCFPTSDWIATKSGAALVKLLPRELAHILSRHVLCNLDKNDICLSIDSDLLHEAIDSIVVHDHLAHVIGRLEAVEERLRSLLIVVGRRTGSAAGRVLVELDIICENVVHSLIDIPEHDILN